MHQRGQGGEAAAVAWRRTARAFAAAVEAGRLELPLPGAGGPGNGGPRSPTSPGKTCRWSGWARGTPMRWRSWPSSAARGRTRAAAGACGRRTRPGPT